MLPRSGASCMFFQLILRPFAKASRLGGGLRGSAYHGRKIQLEVGAGGTSCEQGAPVRLLCRGVRERSSLVRSRRPPALPSQQGTPVQARCGTAVGEGSGAEPTGRSIASIIASVRERAVWCCRLVSAQKKLEWHSRTTLLPRAASEWFDGPGVRAISAFEGVRRPFPVGQMSRCGTVVPERLSQPEPNNINRVELSNGSTRLAPSVRMTGGRREPCAAAVVSIDRNSRSALLAAREDLGWKHRLLSNGTQPASGAAHCPLMGGNGCGA